MAQSSPRTALQNHALPESESPVLILKAVYQEPNDHLLKSSWGLATQGTSIMERHFKGRAVFQGKLGFEARSRPRTPAPLKRLRVSVLFPSAL